MISIVHGPKFNSACHLPLSIVTVTVCCLSLQVLAMQSMHVCMHMSVKFQVYTISMVILLSANDYID